MVTRLMTEFSSNELHNDFPILIWTAPLIEDQSLVSISSDVTLVPGAGAGGHKYKIRKS